jgi:hypothetical protein
VEVVAIEVIGVIDDVGAEGAFRVNHESVIKHAHPVNVNAVADPRLVSLPVVDMLE